MCRLGPQCTEGDNIHKPDKHTDCSRLREEKASVEPAMHSDVAHVSVRQGVIGKIGLFEVCADALCHKGRQHRLNLGRVLL